jgi:predicted permease
MFFDHLLRNLRVGTRMLLKERGFSALAITVLALGICGVTTMFSVVNGVMLRGFNFPNDDRLASANLIDPSSVTAFGVNGQVQAMDYEELRPVQQSFDKLAGYLNGSTVNVTVNGEPRRYVGAYVTSEFLSVLGISPAKGRDFTAADNVPGAPGTLIISHGLWQRDFGSDEHIVGRAVTLNGKPATIIGVMAPGFAFPVNEQLWVPIYTEFPPRPRNDPRSFGMALVGTLKTGVSHAQATTEFTGIAQRFAAAYPETNKQFNAGRVEPLIATFTPVQLRGTLLTMLAFCVGVLLIACVNVMNMQFARATMRAKELAIRSSLGGSRVRLISQMLTESLQLAAAGAALGIGLAFLAIGRLTAAVRSLENPPPAWITFDVDGPVLIVTIVATMLAALVSGTLPALMASRTNTNVMLRDASRGSTSGRAGLISRGLVVFQIVITCVLLIGSLLQLRSIVNQETIDFGYDTGGVLSARMGLMDGAYPTSEARQGLLHAPGAAARREFVICGGRAHQPVSHGVFRQRAGRNRGTHLSRPHGSHARELRAGDARILQRDGPEAGGWPRILGRRQRPASASGGGQCGVCRQALPTRAGDRPPVPHHRAGRQPARRVANDRGRRLHGAHARPVQQPRRGRSGVLRAVLRPAGRAAGPDARRQPVRNGPGAAAPRAVRQRAGA